MGPVESGQLGDRTWELQKIHARSRLPVAFCCRSTATSAVAASRFCSWVHYYPAGASYSVTGRALRLWMLLRRKFRVHHPCGYKTPAQLCCEVLKDIRNLTVEVPTTTPSGSWHS